MTVNIRKIMICMVLAVLFLTPVLAYAEEAGEDYENVTYLNLDEQRLNYNMVKSILAKYPNLKKVDMFNVQLYRNQVEELASLYPEIEFGWTMKIGKDHTVRTDATAFSTMHFSNSQPHSTADIAVLRFCKNLKALDIGHNSVNDISWLTELPDLRFLIIAINKVTDITPLASLTKLEYLEMFNNNISDLTPLTGLTHLMDLNIGYNLITDYTPLYEMTWLKRLWLGKAYKKKNDIPADVIEMLKEKLPNTQLDWKSNPTMGGWRDHPHHDVIDEMFDYYHQDRMHYVPFSDSFPDLPEDDEDEDL